MRGKCHSAIARQNIERRNMIRTHFGEESEYEDECQNKAPKKSKQTKTKLDFMGGEKKS